MSLITLVNLDDTLTERSAAFDACAELFLATHDRPADELGRIRELDRRGGRPREEFFALALEHLALDLDLGTELAAYRTATGTPRFSTGCARLAEIRGDGGLVVVLTRRWVGFPFGDTMVPQMPTVASDTVTSRSHLRIVSTSPIRADVPSKTSMTCSS